MARTCTITRSFFHAKAKPVAVRIDCLAGGEALTATPKLDKGKVVGESLGYLLNGKVTLSIDGKDVECQVGMNITVIGSKDIPVS